MQWTDISGRTPLLSGFHSISAENIPILDILIEAKANVNAKDPKGNTPLHLAVETYRPNTIAVLIRAGANTAALNKSNRTPLELAKVRYDKQPINGKNPSAIRALATYPTRDELSPILTAVLSMQQAIGKSQGKDLAKQHIVPVLIDDLIQKKLAFIKQYVPDAPDAELIKEIKTNIYAALNRKTLAKDTSSVAPETKTITWDVKSDGTNNNSNNNIR